MATLHSFETTCHLEAIERDLVDILVETGMIEFLRADVKELEFHKLLSEMDDKSIEVIEAPAVEELKVESVLDTIAGNFKDMTLNK
ncbi:unnamed protein product [marine sediment metagenome]|uniref:Uncharacterized protein n=1 Tax=marine sediment metagenome TaxID=412755 RepID=X1AIL3_9ZZZZ